MAALDSWSGHVLVIESNAPLRGTLASALADCGWRVSEASTGYEGLRILEDTRPQVVLTAFKLPDLPGTAALQRIQEIDPDVPVILLKSKAMQADVLDALREGAFDCIDRDQLDDDRAIPAVERAASHYRKLQAAFEMHERSQSRYHGLEDQVRSLRTQLATTELSLVQARGRAEDADRAKSSFLANMSHELRTPLNAILGYTELLSEDASNDPEAAHDLRRIHGAGTHLLRLISDVLDLARIESGKSELYYETIEVGALIKQATTKITHQLDTNQLVIGSIAHTTIVSDYAKMLLILERILGNANKFTTNGTVRVNTEQSDERLAIHVSDTGIGMSPAEVRTIFREFSQGDGSTTRRYGGTGLGLTIALRLTELLNGTIRVESEQGKGSTFTLEFPCSPPEWDEMLVETTPMQPEPEPDRPTVLVIDGDATLRRQMATYLTKAGYRVISTPSGSEAMRLARLHRPAIISLDVVLPDVDGWNLLMAFKSDVELRDIPIVLVTVAEDRSRGLAVGAADFLPKPIRRDALLAVIHRVGPSRNAGPILVVEDDEDTRTVTSRMLSAEGWQTDTAENGRIALEWLAKNPTPSLILLDLMMPEIDGFTVITELQANDAWRSIPVVVFTAMDVPPSRLSFLEAHVETVIRKGGFGQARMLEEVRGLISRSLK